MDTWDMIIDQRRQLAGVLDSLDNAQWDAQTLCEAWKTRDVVGHVVSFNELGALKITLRMARHFFKFDQMNAKLGQDIGKNSPKELMNLVRKHTEGRFVPPGVSIEALLADAAIHTEDICRPLGIQKQLDAEKAIAILDYLSGPTGGGLGDPAWIEGLHLAPHDVDWSKGDGPKVTGLARDIVVVLSGWRAPLDSLSGDGVDQLRARMSA